MSHAKKERERSKEVRDDDDSCSSSGLAVSKFAQFCPEKTETKKERMEQASDHNKKALTLKRNSCFTHLLLLPVYHYIFHIRNFYAQYLKYVVHLFGGKHKTMSLLMSVKARSEHATVK